jgi:hypothetical protein
MPLDATLTAETGGDVDFRFRIVNGGTSAVDLTFRTGKRADVVVRAADSAETVWRWSEGRAFAQAVSRTTVRPGEQIEQSFTWADPPPGSYVATGTLEADREVHAETELTV